MRILLAVSVCLSLLGCEELMAPVEHAPVRDLSEYQLPQDLADIPTDPRNRLTPEKVQLGKELFFSNSLGTNPLHRDTRETFSCASCHLQSRGFTAGQRQGLGEGGIGDECRIPRADFPRKDIDAQPVRTPTAINIAFSDVVLTDGSLGMNAANVDAKEHWAGPRLTNSLGFLGPETQAIAGLTVHRQGDCKPTCPEKLEVLLQSIDFDQEQDHTVKFGLAIAAFERSLVTKNAPFQRYLRGEKDALNKDQLKGMDLFFGKAGCTECHTGPALNSDDTISVGLGNLEGDDVLSRFGGGMRGRGGFDKNPAHEDQYRVPQLYNLRDMVPLGHGGTLRNVREAVEYFARGRVEDVNAKNLDPRHRDRGLTPEELEDLTCFVEFGLYDPDLR